jgi:hypothetical protein
MRSTIKVFLAAMLLCLPLLPGCQREEPAATPQISGFVDANPAYRNNFGTPPQGKEGRAFARVGYLPLQQEPEKLCALPLFLFTDQDQLEKILARLVSGELLLHRDSDLYNPFPSDLALSVTSADGPTVTLDLTTQQEWPAADLAAGSRALAETALQFNAVKQVIILLNGSPVTNMPAEGFVHEQELLVQVGPPKLILLSGVWEQGAEVLNEILVEFDRPIKMKNFKLSTADGSNVEGDYYTSIFQMAVVVHPIDPGRYHDGMQLQVDWEVADDLGRANRGTSTLPLRRIEH